MYKLYSLASRRGREGTLGQVCSRDHKLEITNPSSLDFAPELLVLAPRLKDHMPILHGLKLVKVVNDENVS